MGWEYRELIGRMVQLKGVMNFQHSKIDHPVCIYTLSTATIQYLPGWLSGWPWPVLIHKLLQLFRGVSSPNSTFALLISFWRLNTKRKTDPFRSQRPNRFHCNSMASDPIVPTKNKYLLTNELVYFTYFCCNFWLRSSIFRIFIMAWHPVMSLTFNSIQKEQH